MLSGRCPFILLFASPMRLQKFFCFCSRLPFRVFTLESLFFISIFNCFFHHFSFFIVLLCTWKFIPNRWMIYQESWLRKRDNSPVDYKKFLKEDSLHSEYPRSIKMDFLGTQCRPGFGVLKEMINRHRLCFRVIRPRIIFIITKDHFSLSLHSSLFFDYSFLFVPPFLFHHHFFYCPIMHLKIHPE